MRSLHAGLAIMWSGLAAVASAEALPPEDIPIQCARMCGPMVELTSQCTPRRAVRRSGPDQESVAGESHLDVDAPQRRHRRRAAGQGEAVDGDVEKRNLLVIVAAPAPGRPETITKTETEQARGKERTSVTRINPEIVSPSTSMRAAPPPSPSPLAPSPPIARPPVGAVDSARPAPAPTSSSLPSRTSALSPVLGSSPTRASSQTPRTLSTLDSPPSSAVPPSETRKTSRVVSGSDGPRQTPQRPADDGGQRGATINQSPLGAEEKCVCLNTSFNVSEVAALCSSCIMQSGDNMNNLNIIMSTCNFSPVTYVDGNESIVQNIRVSATRPTVVGNANGVVNRAPQAAAPGTALRSMCLVTGMAMLVWAYCP